MPCSAPTDAKDWKAIVRRAHDNARESRFGYVFLSDPSFRLPRGAQLIEIGETGTADRQPTLRELRGWLWNRRKERRMFRKTAAFWVRQRRSADSERWEWGVGAVTHPSVTVFPVLWRAT